MWWSALFGPLAVAAAPHVHIDRLARELWVSDSAGNLLHRAPIGIGRGGLGPKGSMSDRITPTGTFTVDLVLQKDGQHNAISPTHRQTWAGHPTWGGFVDTDQGLADLFRNMSGLDFNGDGAPDRAYGAAYVGLDSAEAVTGPKMHRYRGTSYWYSIALHGTPDPTSLGEARSGGCVHVGAELLLALIADGTLAVGQTVVIADGPPAH